MSGTEAGTPHKSVEFNEFLKTCNQQRRPAVFDPAVLGRRGMMNIALINNEILNQCLKKVVFLGDCSSLMAFL